ncbi:MAG: hypothetical protein LQ348_000698 [Seirophora lacunosa]|nr:MAG: hypothetical protein LQ348_000698 [Seirophora lacunosa]
MSAFNICEGIRGRVKAIITTSIARVELDQQQAEELFAGSFGTSCITLRRHASIGAGYSLDDYVVL